MPQEAACIVLISRQLLQRRIGEPDQRCRTCFCARCKMCKNVRGVGGGGGGGGGDGGGS